MLFVVNAGFTIHAGLTENMRVFVINGCAGILCASGVIRTWEALKADREK